MSFSSQYVSRQILIKRNLTYTRFATHRLYIHSHFCDRLVSSTQTFSLSRNNVSVFRYAFDSFTNIYLTKKVVYSSKNHTTVVTTPTMPLFDDIEIRIEAIKAISVSLQQYRRALSLSGLQERIATWIRARKADAYRARHKQVRSPPHMTQPSN